MSWKPVLNRKETIIGHTDTARVIYPSLRASIRRSDPDGSSTVPYYSSLLGKNLTVEIVGTVNSIYVIGFVSNSYTDAIDLINSTDPANLKGEDDNGFLRITNLNGGSKNAIKINSGSAAAILGFDFYPLPTGISYAGEISTTATGWPYQSNDQLTSLIAKDEGFQGSSFNRALAAIMTMNDAITSNQDREIAFPRRIDVTVSGGAFSISGLDSGERLFVTGNTLSPLVVPNPSLDTLDKYLVFLDRNDNQVFVNDTRVRVSAVTYGAFVSSASSFSTWGTPDGKSVFGDSVHLSKNKTTGTIDTIKGNVLNVPGALFVTKKVQPNDTVIISGATNNTPFNHNGDFVVESVIDENNVILRTKGDADTVFDSGNPPPAALNTYIQVGEVYGDISVPLGRFMPFTMPGASMVFTLSPAPPDGNYRLIAPIGRTIRNALAEDITLSTISRPFGGQIELGSKLGASNGGLSPRIILPPNTLDQFTFAVSSKASGNSGSRTYYTASGVELQTYNAKWDGTKWNKDSVGTSRRYKFDVNGITQQIHTDTTLAVTQFNESDWRTVTDIQDFRFTEDFYGNRTVTTVGNDITPDLKLLSKTGTPTMTIKANTNGVGSTVTGSAGLFYPDVPISGVWNFEINSHNTFGIGQRDFILKIKTFVNSGAISLLDTQSTPGFFVGLRNVTTTTPTFKVGVFSGSDSTTWMVNTGIATSSLTSTFPNPFGYDVFTFERSNGVLYISINDQLQLQVANTINMAESEFYIRGSGNASVIGGIPFVVDYVKLWFNDSV